MSLSRRSECPGPCNPRNRVCRRNCIQNVASILEELPPCIRMRLCEEDLFAVLAKNYEQETRAPNHRPTSDNASSDPNWQTSETSTLRKDDATTKRSSGKTDQEEKQTGEDKVSMIENKDTQTESADEKPAENMIETTDNTGIRALPSAKNAIAQETCASISTRVSPSASPKASTKASSKASSNASSNGCRRYNGIIYSTILLLLAVFAWNSPAYRIFLSSQICGILVVLSWRISGSVPF